MCDKMNPREPPLTRLPPVLLALVFKELTREEKILCIMIHKYWQELIASLWPKLKRNPDNILARAAINGSMPLMRFSKKWGATKFDWALMYAAMYGHINCMKLAKEWGATNFEGTLWDAAGKGHLDCIKLLKEWGANTFNSALQCAIRGSHIDCEKLLKTWINERGEG